MQQQQPKQALYLHQSINQSTRKTSNVQNLTHLENEHQAPDHEHTQPMMALPYVQSFAALLDCDDVKAFAAIQRSVCTMVTGPLR
jgi:hypothetical protein